MLVIAIKPVKLRPMCILEFLCKYFFSSRNQTNFKQRELICYFTAQSDMQVIWNVFHVQDTLHT